MQRATTPLIQIELIEELSVDAFHLLCLVFCLLETFMERQEVLLYISNLLL